MALDFLKGAAQGIAGKALRKVSGNLPGLLGFGGGMSGGDGTSAGLTQTKFSTKNYQFPLDVEGPPGTGNQGHYIMFFINQQSNAKLGFGNKETKNHSDFSSKVKSQNKIPNYIKKLNKDGSYTKVSNSSSISNQILSKANEALSDTGIKTQVKNSGSTVTVDRLPTTRMDTAITLFMPPQVSVSYGSTYTDFEIGAAAVIAGNAVTDVMNDMTLKGFQDAVGKAGPQIVSEAVEGAVKVGLKAVSIVPGMTNLDKLFDMKRGQIKAPRMELAFEGINKREFSYNFKMMPKSQAEADEIRKIIFAFKSNMLPEFVDDNRAGRRLTVPNTFDISYMYNGSENQYLHKISTCVCTSLQVSYGGDRYKTFDPSSGDGAPPVDTSIALTFKELELITRERVYEGY
jgi:hypothetical protein|tara:strand:- start:235 stop:1437 length:1203 start_codon:yes stop_codon:yes gene_type:complete